MSRNLRSFMPFGPADETDQRPPKPPLLLTHIDHTKSVIHAIAQDAGRKLCDAFGHDRVEDWDEFLSSEPGRKFKQAIRDGAVHLLNKAL